MKIECILPIRLVSEANASGHWTDRYRRKKHQQEVTALFLVTKILPVKERIKKGAVVTITLVGSQRIDSDNLVGAGKFVRDAIAKLIGIDDGDPIIEWRVVQEKGKRCTKVCIETRD